MCNFQVKHKGMFYQSFTSSKVLSTLKTISTTGWTASLPCCFEKIVFLFLKVLCMLLNNLLLLQMYPTKSCDL